MKKFYEKLLLQVAYAIQLPISHDVLLSTVRFRKGYAYEGLCAIYVDITHQFYYRNVYLRH
ncbi:hypothetical protein [Bacillus sp. 166amftsu]|uniref:hypothetical protein n=1 Tax=Bacillus sp. 166amftsu TaxID=1761753 RepID=UPI0008943D97|nr:hypothetical protein [Bacillus sp. 166amftsu]SDZ24997.1 hypothetical protein SAMN04488156_11170 [Bacillus sp. 166amftsu]